MWLSGGVCKCSFSFLFSSPLSSSSFSSPCSQFSLSSPLHVPNPFRKLQQPIFHVKVSYAGYNIDTDAEESNIWACEYQQTHFVVLAQIFLGLCEEISYTHIKNMQRACPSASYLELEKSQHQFSLSLRMATFWWCLCSSQPFTDRAALCALCQPSWAATGTTAVRWENWLRCVLFFVVGDAFIPENMYCW